MLGNLALGMKDFAWILILGKKRYGIKNRKQGLIHAGLRRAFDHRTSLIADDCALRFPAGLDFTLRVSLNPDPKIHRSRVTFLLRFRAFEPCVHTLFLVFPSCIGLLWPYNPRLSAKISSKQPFRKLQKSTADMPANDKVGSWLGDAKGAADGDESDESDSAPVQRSNGQTRRGEDAEDEEDDDEEEEVNGAADGVKREENVEWETVLPKVRPALEDPSDKRRRTFIGRYLYVSESCKLHLAYAVPVIHQTDGTAPPPSSIGPLLQAILGALPLLLHSKQVDDAISLLQALVERDEKLEEGAASKAKLAEKLGKWTGMEVGKAVDASRSYVHVSLAWPCCTGKM
jgi:hypothetical protein